mgnify:CR=1 FL=1
MARRHTLPPSPSGAAQAADRRPRFWRWLWRSSALAALIGAAWLCSRPFTPAFRSDAALGEGFWHYSNGRYEQAVQAFGEALTQDPLNAAAHLNRGDAYAALGQWEAALADYDAVIALYPEYPWAYASRGEAYLVLGRAGQALADFDTVIALKPDYALAYYDRASTYDLLGDAARTSADYARFLELYDLPDARADYARERLQELASAR